MPKPTTTEAKVVPRTTVPSFRQLCAIVRQMCEEQPTASDADLLEAIKCRHVQLGYLHSIDQLPRALDAVERTLRRRVILPTYLARPPTPSPPELAQQVDPPWPGIHRQPSTWTRLGEIINPNNKPSGRST
jgi:hypothetical protein